MPGVAYTMARELFELELAEHDAPGAPGEPELLSVTRGAGRAYVAVFTSLERCARMIAGAVAMYNALPRRGTWGSAASVSGRDAAFAEPCSGEASELSFAAFEHWRILRAVVDGHLLDVDLSDLGVPDLNVPAPPARGSRALFEAVRERIAAARALFAAWTGRVRRALAPGWRSDDPRFPPAAIAAAAAVVDAAGARDFLVRNCDLAFAVAARADQLETQLMWLSGEQETSADEPADAAADADAYASEDA